MPALDGHTNLFLRCSGQRTGLCCAGFLYEVFGYLGGADRAGFQKFITS